MDLDAVEGAAATWCSMETEVDMRRRATMEEVLATTGERIVEDIIVEYMIGMKGRVREGQTCE